MSTRFATIVYTPAGAQSDWFFANVADLRTVHPLISFGSHWRSTFFIPDQGIQTKTWYAAYSFKHAAQLATALGYDAIFYIENDSFACRNKWDAAIFDQFDPFYVLGHLTAWGPANATARRWLNKRQKESPNAGLVYCKNTRGQVSLYPNGANTLMRVEFMRIVARYLPMNQPFDNYMGLMGVNMYGAVEWRERLRVLQHSFSYCGDVGIPVQDRMRRIKSGEFVIGHQLKVQQKHLFETEES